MARIGIESLGEYVRIHTGQEIWTLKYIGIRKP